MADELHRLTAHEARKLLSNRDVSSVELTQAVLDRIAAVDDRLGAYITVSDESALAQAADADKSLSNGGGGLLTGVPVSVKDNMCTKGIRTTCGSRMLETFIPPPSTK